MPDGLRNPGKVTCLRELIQEIYQERMPRPHPPPTPQTPLEAWRSIRKSVIFFLDLRLVRVILWYFGQWIIALNISEWLMSLVMLSAA